MIMGRDSYDHAEALWGERPHLVPVILGRGRRLFSGLDDEPIAMEIIRVVEGPAVTHLKYGMREG
ncbi:hypothetical protein [Microbacterium sp. A94]|uniref:hypothetical protein n=1 Tax=Microbacterium sp. A94 TaxID=3450717 RepID=UPI003F6E296C